MELPGAVETKGKQKEVDIFPGQAWFHAYFKAWDTGTGINQKSCMLPNRTSVLKQAQGEKYPEFMTPLDVRVHTDRSFFLVLPECHFAASCGISLTSSVE